MGWMDNRSCFQVRNNNQFRSQSIAIFNHFTYRQIHSQQQIPESEYTALYDLYNATNGNYWTWEYPFKDFGVPWNFRDSSHPCLSHWQGLTCANTTTGLHIVELSFRRNNMTGTLSDSLSSLTQLRLLHLTFNDLHGSIPATLADLVHLEVLELFQNKLDGSIPSSITKLSNLTALALGTNHLGGAIPSGIGAMTALTGLNIGNNYLTGSIPDSIKLMKNLEEVYLGYNRLTGTMSENLSLLTNLRVLSLTHNFLNGTIPSTWSALTQLEALVLSHNELTGTIPSTIFASMNKLKGFDVAVNYLHGPIPSTLWKNTLVEVLFENNLLSGLIPSELQLSPSLAYMNISNNILTGTIPHAVGDLYQLQYFSCMYNRFSGTLPDTLNNLQRLQGLTMRHNLFTGHVPSLRNLSSLVTLDLQDNQLTGPLSHIIQASQYNILDIQLNENLFTGELPAVFFQLPHLSSLGISKSCLHGTFPANVCNATSLITLVLYGLSTGGACKSTLYTQTFEDNLPLCLLNLPKIRTLLMSSNRLIATMHSGWEVNNRTLTQLDMCHNQLRGTIPDSIQNRAWSLLDLSYNKFSGGLSDQLRLVDNGNLTLLPTSDRESVNATFLQGHFRPSLSLEVNRLSGPVVNSVRQMHDLSVLAGNLFQCRYDKSNLPQHDTDFTTYQCASNAFDLSIYLLISAAGVTVMLVWVYLRFYHASGWRTVLQMFETTVLPVNLSTLLDAYGLLNKVAAYCTLFCMVVLLPYYVVVSRYQGTHTHQYAYAVSFIYTSGITAFVVTTLLLVVLMCIAYAFVVRVQVFSDENAYQNDPATVVARRYVSIVYTSMNVAAVLGVNIAFIYIVLYQTSEAQTFAQVALSVFKLFWSMEVSPYMMRKLDAYYLPLQSKQSNEHKHSYFTLQLLVALFNNIAIPCLVVLAIDPNCFSARLLPPQPETVEYLLTTCTSLGTTADCNKRDFRVESFEFTPPFVYSYQCSASFITSYAPAFVYMSISTVFLNPLVQYALLQVRKQVPLVSMLHRLASWPLPRLLKPPTEKALQQYSAVHARPLVGATGVLVTLYTQLGILLTFGAIFPPIALAMAMSIAAVVYLTRFKVQRFVQAAMDAQLLGFMEIINAECAKVGTREQMQLAVQIIVCYCCAFYTLFLFDTLGDAEGFTSSVWVLFVVPLAPVVGFGVNKMVILYQVHVDRKPGVEGVELSTVVNKLSTQMDDVGPTTNVLHLTV